MKKILVAVSIILALNFSIAAQTTEGKEIRHRDIEWSDFTGAVDPTSQHDAYTYWMTSYSFPSPAFRGEIVRINVTVRLFLTSRSWVRPDRQTPRLLNHERGHHRIGRICANLIERTINSTDLSRKNYHKEIDSIYWETIKKCRLVEEQYDVDTDHYKNVEQQTAWDRKLIELLNER